MFQIQNLSQFQGILPSKRCQNGSYEDQLTQHSLKLTKCLIVVHYSSSIFENFAWLFEFQELFFSILKRPFIDFFFRNLIIDHDSTYKGKCPLLDMKICICNLINISMFIMFFLLKLHVSMQVMVHTKETKETNLL